MVEGLGSALFDLLRVVAKRYSERDGGGVKEIERAGKGTREDERVKGESDRVRRSRVGRRRDVEDDHARDGS